MTKMYEKLYSKTATQTLAGFQLIEQSLKGFLISYNSIVQLLLKGNITFKYNPDEIENAPLGRLCSRFSKCSDNESLIKRINSLTSDRNHLAHKALALLYDQHVDEDVYKEENDKFMKVSRQIPDLLDEISGERMKLLDIIKKQI